MEYDDRPDGGSSHLDPALVLDRLTTQFGADSIRSLTQRFATTLQEALREVGTETAQDTAHRVAGIAGTLGFSAVSRGFQALSQGDHGATDALRRDSAQALAIIGARYGSSAGG